MLKRSFHSLFAATLLAVSFPVSVVATLVNRLACRAFPASASGRDHALRDAAQSSRNLAFDRALEAYERLIDAAAR
jgi:lauroyl/myristoyl acyltransferase